MPRKQWIGKYQHRPASVLTRTESGALRHSRPRRRFPYLGLVPLGYAALGPGVAAGTQSLLARLHLLPERGWMPGQSPPSGTDPAFDNVLFGAGVPEVALASAVAGYLLWRALWRTPGPDPKEGWRAGLGTLLPCALYLGPMYALVAGLIAAGGLFIRTAPANIPAAARVLFAPLGAFAVGASAAFTLIVPAVVVLLGLLFGVATAALIAALWPHYPEEADYR